MTGTRALAYVPEDTARWLPVVMAHLERRGHQLVTLVQDDPDGSKWAAAEDLLFDGTVDVVVVAVRSHIPRMQRIEVAGDVRPPGQGRASQRRPQYTRPDDER